MKLKIDEIRKRFMAPKADSSVRPPLPPQRSSFRVVNGIGELLSLLHEHEKRIKALEDIVAELRGHLNL